MRELHSYLASLPTSNAPDDAKICESNLLRESGLDDSSRGLCHPCPLFLTTQDIPAVCITHCHSFSLAQRRTTYCSHYGAFTCSVGQGCSWVSVVILHVVVVQNSFSGKWPSGAYLPIWHCKTDTAVCRVPEPLVVAGRARTHLLHPLLQTSATSILIQICVPRAYTTGSHNGGLQNKAASRSVHLSVRRKTAGSDTSPM